MALNSSFNYITTCGIYRQNVIVFSQIITITTNQRKYLNFNT